MKHWNIRIFGKVQGVFVRETAKREAEILGIKGFVRNEPDGSVYIEAEGEELDLKQFVGWCRRGTPYSAVERVSSEVGPPQNFTHFSIF